MANLCYLKRTSTIPVASSPIPSSPATTTPSRATSASHVASNGPVVAPFATSPSAMAAARMPSAPFSVDA